MPENNNEVYLPCENQLSLLDNPNLISDIGDFVITESHVAFQGARYNAAEHDIDPIETLIAETKAAILNGLKEDL